MNILTDLFGESPMEFKALQEFNDYEFNFHEEQFQHAISRQEVQFERQQYLSDMNFSRDIKIDNDPQYYFSNELPQYKQNEYPNDFSYNIQPLDDKSCFYYQENMEENEDLFMSKLSENSSTEQSRSTSQTDLKPISLLSLTELEKSQTRSDNSSIYGDELKPSKISEDSQLPIIRLLEALVSTQNKKESEAREKYENEFINSNIYKHFCKEKVDSTSNEGIQKFQKDVIKEVQRKVIFAKFIKKNTKPKKYDKKVKCEHTEEKYYANGLCRNCYHRKGRNKYATECPHSTSLLYAKGLCKNCYQNVYNRFNLHKNKINKNMDRCSDRKSMSETPQ
eukprot:403366569